MVFTTQGQGMEVWRRIADSLDPRTYLPCTPHPSQIDISPEPVPTFPAQYPPVYHQLPPVNPHTPAASGAATLPEARRGAYLPFGLLQNSTMTSASRFVYPTLAVVSAQEDRAFIWDVPTSTLIRTIDMQSPLDDSQPTGRICYIDISTEYLFVAFSAHGVYAYRRQTQDGHNAPAFSVPTAKICGPPCKDVPYNLALIANLGNGQNRVEEFAPSEGLEDVSLPHSLYLGLS